MKNAIEINALTKRYGDKIALNALSMTVKEGELLALLGLNGAGKSTCVRCLAGLCRPDSGDAYLLGHSILEETDAVKSIIGISPQESATAPNLTVRENLELIARLYGADKKTAEARVCRLSEIFSLESVLDQKSKTLSGGWQRRLSIAMALAGEPELLFLDEPTLGLDVLARRELWRFIRSLKGKMTILLTTHYLEEAESLADRVAILRAGELCAYGTPEALCEQAGAADFEEAFVTLAQERGERYEKNMDLGRARQS